MDNDNSYKVPILRDHTYQHDIWNHPSCLDRYKIGIEDIGDVVGFEQELEDVDECLAPRQSTISRSERADSHKISNGRQVLIAIRGMHSMIWADSFYSKRGVMDMELEKLYRRSDW